VPVAAGAALDSPEGVAEVDGALGGGAALTTAAGDEGEEDSDLAG
jgi:hypothetical protein